MCGSLNYIHTYNPLLPAPALQLNGTPVARQKVGLQCPPMLFSYFSTLHHGKFNTDNVIAHRRSFKFILRDVPVDIYGGLWFFPEGREFFSHQTGGENFFFHQAGGEIFFFTTQGEGIFFSPDGERFFPRIQDQEIFSAKQ